MNLFRRREGKQTTQFADQLPSWASTYSENCFWWSAGKFTHLVHTHRGEKAATRKKSDWQTRHQRAGQCNICLSQQNEHNEQEQLKSLWLTQHRVQKANSFPFSDVWGGGVCEMSILMHWNGGSFPRLPVRLHWSRNLPCSTVLWTLSCSDSTDQVQHTVLTKGMLPCGQS